MPKITIRVGKDGQLTVLMAGVSEPLKECELRTALLREGLGETVELEASEECTEHPEVETTRERLKE